MDSDSDRVSSLLTFRILHPNGIDSSYFIDTKMVVVRGRPSPALSSQIEAEEHDRVSERVTRLGKKGLEKQKAIVEAAQNDKDLIPNEILAAIPPPDFKTISWINVQSVSTKAGSPVLEKIEDKSQKLAAHIRADGCTLPFSLHFDHVSVSNPTQYCLGLSSLL